MFPVIFNSGFHNQMFLGKQEEVDATIETLKVVKGPFSHWARVMVDICAYAGKFYLAAKS